MKLLFLENLNRIWEDIKAYYAKLMPSTVSETNKLVTSSDINDVERTTSKETTIDAQTTSTSTYPTSKAVVTYVNKAVDESASDNITSDAAGKMAFEHTTYLFSTHDVTTGVATPPNLEEGPWFKNGVQTGTNDVYIDERDYAIVLEDETRCYAYYKGYKYQRIKDGGDSLSGYVKVADSASSWIHCQPFDLTQVSNGARPAYMFFKDNKDANQIILITLSDRKVFIYKDVQYEEGFDNIDTKPFIDATPTVAEAFPCQIKFVNNVIQATLVDCFDTNPELVLKYPTTKYICTVAQSATNPIPTWQYQLTYNDMSFNQEEYNAIKSTATKEKIDQIALNTEAIAGKQDAFDNVSETNDTLNIDENIKVTSDTEDVVNIKNGSTISVKTKHYQGGSKIEIVSGGNGDGDGASTAQLSSTAKGSSATTVSASASNSSGSSATTTVSASSPHNSKVDIKATGGTGYNDTIQLNLETSSVFSNNSINIKANHPSQSGTSSVNMTADKVTVNGVSISNNIRTTNNVVAGDFYVLGNISSLVISEIETETAFELNGKFTASDAFTLPSQDSQGNSISWYGDTEIESGSTYLFSILLSDGIILKLE